MISLNNPVPDFTACATGNKTLSLSDYRGHKVLLYFYPKDNTAGCTQQAQSFRDYHPQFAALNTVILGVSRDSVRTHENFKAKHALPFELLCDSDESLCQLFAVIVQKMLYGKQVRGIERSSFLIDEQGVLIGQWRKLKVAGHSEAVIAFLENLES
jgi:peroxiredoxin Q/BCP